MATADVGPFRERMAERFEMYDALSEEVRNRKEIAQSRQQQDQKHYDIVCDLSAEARPLKNDRVYQKLVV